MVLGVRRIKETPTVIVLFNGMKVPNYVHCGPNMLRCTLYKRQIDTCRNCDRIGHRHDTMSALDRLKKCVKSAGLRSSQTDTNVCNRSACYAETLISPVTVPAKTYTKFPTL
ncbi:hypothetical protein HPB51_003463 [Rhipicephalus microplus]|uniref:Uncharacterized protein n=1 Tax=Rhipicephalus microplus TaxID=6941 RepID=A0A9J6EEY7_RHIMP|nr:hypothetical protein HPB51_003463 [Rhipicephalus microplus]